MKVREKKKVLECRMFQLSVWEFANHNLNVAVQINPATKKSQDLIILLDLQTKLRNKI